MRKILKVVVEGEAGGWNCLYKVRHKIPSQVSYLNKWRGGGSLDLSVNSPVAYPPTYQEYTHFSTNSAKMHAPRTNQLLKFTPNTEHTSIAKLRA